MPKGEPKTKRSGKIQLTMVFDENVVQAIEKHAATIGEDRNDIIRRAVRQHLAMIGVTIPAPKKTASK